MIPCPRRTPEDVEVGHIMEGEEAGLPIYAALGARPKRPAASARAPAQARSAPGGGGGPPQLEILRFLDIFRGWRRGWRGRVEVSHLCRRTRGPEAEKTPTRGGWTIFYYVFLIFFYWLVIDFSIFLQYFVLFWYFSCQWTFILMLSYFFIDV